MHRAYRIWRSQLALPNCATQLRKEGSKKGKNAGAWPDSRTTNSAHLVPGRSSFLVLTSSSIIPIHPRLSLHPHHPLAPWGSFGSSTASLSPSQKLFFFILSINPSCSRLSHLLASSSITTQHITIHALCVVPSCHCRQSWLSFSPRPPWPPWRLSFWV